jgi:phosphoglycerate dehydrogenase-like enzyme
MNMSVKIKVTVRAFCQNQVLRSELLEVFPNAEFNEGGHRYQGQELVDYLDDVDGAIVGLDPMTSDVIRKLTNLKVISKFGVGLDNVDVEFAKSQGKVIGWSGGVNRRSVAEEAIGFMLGLTHNLFQTSYQLKQGFWNKNGGVQLSGRTVGIVGCGFVGADLLKLLQPFGCKLLICDILDKTSIAKQYQASQVEFSEIVVESDILSLHVPLTELTQNMIDAAVLQRMKTTAFVINTSRGPVIDQTALKEALMKGEISGAALDVFEEEPPKDLEFLALPNLIPTPHIGGNAEEAVLAMGRSAIAHLKTAFISL